MFKIVVQHLVFPIHRFVEEEAVEFTVHAVEFLSFVEGVGQLALARMRLAGDFNFFEYQVAEGNLYGAYVVAITAEHGVFDDVFGVVGVVEEVVAHDVDGGMFLGVGIHGAYGFALAAVDAVEGFAQDAVLHDVGDAVIVEEDGDLHGGAGKALAGVGEVGFDEGEGAVDEFYIVGEVLLFLCL